MKMSVVLMTMALLWSFHLLIENTDENCISTHVEFSKKEKKFREKKVEQAIVFSFSGPNGHLAINAMLCSKKLHVSG